MSEGYDNATKVMIVRDRVRDAINRLNYTDDPAQSKMRDVDDLRHARARANIHLDSALYFLGQLVESAEKGELDV